MGNLGSTTTSPCRVGDCMINTSSSCFLGNCSRLNPNMTAHGWKIDTCTILNQSTCSMMTLESEWNGELSYDEEGCFVNNDLRNTPAYDQYLRVRQAFINRVFSCEASSPYCNLTTSLTDSCLTL